MMPRRSPHLRGFSLIEAAIVLGIVGLVIGGIWAAASTISEKRKLNRTMEQVGLVLQAARTKLKPTMRATDVYMLRNSSCIPGRTCMPRTGWPTYLPADMIGTLPTPTTAYGLGTEITVSPDYLRFSLELGDNIKACAQLGPLLASQYRNEVFGGVPFAVYTSEDGTDISTVAASGAGCRSEYANSGKIVITFTFTT